MAKKILVVEDDEPIQRAIANMLFDAGHEVRTCITTSEAFELASQDKPDLVILDLLLPEKMGVQLLVDLRQTSWGENIPVLVITNVTNKELEMEARKYNIVDYIIKSDISVHELLEKIQTTLDAHEINQ